MSENSAHNERHETGHRNVDPGGDNPEHSHRARFSVRGVQQRIDRGVGQLHRWMERAPSISVLAAGALGLAAANALGVGEVAIAVGAGYAALRFLKNRTGAEAHKDPRQGVRMGEASGAQS